MQQVQEALTVATRTSIPRGSEITKPMWCPNGHRVLVRVDRKGKIRGDGRLVCPHCAAVDGFTESL